MPKFTKIIALRIAFSIMISNRSFAISVFVPYPIQYVTNSASADRSLFSSFDNQALSALPAFFPKPRQWFTASIFRQIAYGLNGHARWVDWRSLKRLEKIFSARGIANNFREIRLAAPELSRIAISLSPSKNVYFKRIIEALLKSALREAWLFPEETNAGLDALLFIVRSTANKSILIDHLFNYLGEQAVTLNPKGEATVIPAVSERIGGFLKLVEI